MFSTVHPSLVDILVYMRSGTPYLRKKSLLILLPMHQPFIACNELKLGMDGNLCTCLIWISLYLHIMMKFPPISPCYSTILSQSFSAIKKINPLQTKNFRVSKQNPQTNKTPKQQKLNIFQTLGWKFYRIIVLFQNQSNGNAVRKIRN